MLMVVKITNLRCKAYLGFFEWEKKRKRNILLNIAYSYTTSVTTKQQILDYDSISQLIAEFLEKNSFELLETLTQNLTDFLGMQANIAWIEIECIKPLALVGAKEVSVTCKKWTTQK